MNDGMDSSRGRTRRRDEGGQGGTWPVRRRRPSTGPPRGGQPV